MQSPGQHARLQSYRKVAAARGQTNTVTRFVLSQDGTHRNAIAKTHTWAGCSPSEAGHITADVPPGGSLPVRAAQRGDCHAGPVLLPQDGRPVHGFVDRAAIDEYVGWLTREGHQRRVVLRRVPTLIQFGEFARSRGALMLADLPRLADAFVVSWIERHARRCCSKRGLDGVRTEAHAPVHQMLRVVLPDLAAAEKVAANAKPWPFDK